MPVLPAELAAEVIYRMKTAGTADLLKCQCGFLQQPPHCLKAVLNECLHRRTAQVGLETPPRFAPADVGGASDICQGNRLGVILVNKRQHFLEAYLRIQLYP